MSDATCKTCPYLGPVVERDDRDGLSIPVGAECRRGRPSVPTEASHYGGWDCSVRAIWPVVRLDDWCGEHPNRSTPDTWCFVGTVKDGTYGVVVGDTAIPLEKMASRAATVKA